MPNQNIVVQTNGLRKILDSRTVLDSIDLRIFEREHVALIGANGSGKTTLLRLLAAVSRATAGEIRWFERTTDGKTVKREIGLVAHETQLYPQLTAAENLAFAARMCGVADVAQRVASWLDSSGLAAYRQRLPSQLSRGLRQRLAIGRGLIHDPRLILLDEAFVGIDDAATEWLSDLLRSPAYRGRTVVFVTHEARHVELLATRVVVLESGKLRDSHGWERMMPVCSASTRDAA